MKNKLLITIAGVALLLTPGLAWATTLTSGPASEDALWEILNDGYGWGLSAANLTALKDYLNEDATNDGVLDNDLNAVFGGLWAYSNVPQIEVTALEAGNDQTFGYYTQFPANNPPSGADLTEVGFDVAVGDSFAVLPPTNPFGWYLNSPVGSSIYWFSQDAYNSDAATHLVGFSLFNIASHLNTLGAGLNAADYTNKFVLAWEDLPENRWDSDYNDLVLEVVLDRGGNVVPVPEPATVTLLGLGLAGLVAHRFRYKRS